MSAVRSTWLLLLVAACTGDPPAGKDTDTDDSPDLDPLVTPTVRFLDDRPPTTADLVAEVLEPDPTATYLWSWTVDGSARADLTTPTVPASETLKDQLWAVSVVASRGEETTTPATATLRIRNSAPDATVTLSPDAPTAEDAITATVDATDADGDPIDLRYRWTVGGILTAVTGDTLPPGSTAKGMLVSVEVTPTDGDDEGAKATVSLTIANGAPRITATSLLPVNPLTGTPLVGTVTRSDPDGDPLTLTFTWYVDGAAVPGITTGDLPSRFFVKGQEVWFTARVTDGQIAATATSERRTIGNTPPTSDRTTLTASASPPTVTSTLTCAGQGFLDADGDAEGWV